MLNVSFLKLVEVLGMGGEGGGVERGQTWTGFTMNVRKGHYIVTLLNLTCFYHEAPFYVCF